MTIPPSSRAETAALLAGGMALALIMGALGFQYLRHLAPCEMCHWQRWPLIAAAMIGLGVMPLRRQDAAWLAAAAIVLLAASGLIGAYQAGMQWGWLPGPQACTSARFIVGSAAAQPEVSCNAVTWSLFGLSLAGYNAILSLGTALAAALILVRKP